MANTEDILNGFNSAYGTTTFGHGRVIARNDNTNNGKVRLYKLNVDSKSARYLEGKNIEKEIFAEPLSPAKGENHGFYYTPEFGDHVIYCEITGVGIFIVGSINNPSWQLAAENIPAESQNIQTNKKEYNTSHWPDLTTKGYHQPDPKVGDVYQPASFLMRWRKNDFLIYNTTKIHDKDHSTAKLMELRSAENQMLQLVDIGNFNTSPGTEGKNSKRYSPVRQTDYRDLWEGFNINKEYWSQKTDKPPETHVSQYVKLATNGHGYSEAPHGDTGADMPDLARGEFRWDDRQADGSHETSKTYCPVYQTLESAKGSERYIQDKPGSGEAYLKGASHREKLKKWIEDTGDAYDAEVQKFNVGHFLTLSNTIYKRRAMLSTSKGHQLVMSDIDKDEKILLNSHRGKHIYMEDSDAKHYDVMWFASQKHHMIFCDQMQTPYLIDDTDKERHRLLDPNQIDMSSYQLIQTEFHQKIWLADSPDSPRIHAHTTDGHELLLLDHDKKISPTKKKGKIQITTSDKQMQITMDVENGDITIQNHNMTGIGKTGDISIMAANDIRMNAGGQILMTADAGYNITGGEWNQDHPKVNVNCGLAGQGPMSPHIPEAIRETVLTDIETTEGDLINKWKPS